VRFRKALGDALRQPNKETVGGYFFSSTSVFLVIRKIWIFLELLLDMLSYQLLLSSGYGIYILYMKNL